MFSYLLSIIDEIMNLTISFSFKQKITHDKITSVISLIKSKITETSLTKKKLWKENNPKTPPRILKPTLK
jgi:hypothetical protein